MKLLVTDTEMISLENVRKVSCNHSTTKHTKGGVPYTVDHYQIVICYTGDEAAEYIECGEDEMGKTEANNIFNRVYKILSD